MSIFLKQALNGDSPERGIKLPNPDSRMAKSPARVDLFLLLAYRFEISPNTYFLCGPSNLKTGTPSKP